MPKYLLLFHIDSLENILEENKSLLLQKTLFFDLFWLNYLSHQSLHYYHCWWKCSQSLDLHEICFGYANSLTQIVSVSHRTLFRHFTFYFLTLQISSKGWIYIFQEQDIDHISLKKCIISSNNRRMIERERWISISLRVSYSLIFTFFKIY